MRSAPEFSLGTENGERFTEKDLQGKTTVLVFYPFAFSPVCTDQLQVYEKELAEPRAAGRRDLRRLVRFQLGAEGFPREART